LEVVANELLFLDGTRQTPAEEAPASSGGNDLPF
jgi:hypothetical protein